MTSGRLIHIRNLTLVSIGIGSASVTINNVWGGLLGKSYHTIWLDSAGTASVTNFWFNGSHDAMQISGTAGAGINLVDGFLINSRVGLRVGGGIGGLYLLGVSMGGELVSDMIVDESLTGTSNLQILIGAQTTLDVTNNGGPALDLVTNGSAVQDVVHLQDAWIAAGFGQPGIRIGSAWQGYVIVQGGEITNNGDGILNNSTTAFIEIGGGVAIGGNTVGLHNNVVNTNFTLGPDIQWGGVGGANGTNVSGNMPPYGILGRRDGGTANTGYIGEALFTRNVTGTAVSANTATQIASLALSPGTWYCNGSVITLPAGGTTTTYIVGGIGLSASMPSPSDTPAYAVWQGQATPAASTETLSLSQGRFATSTAQTAYLMAQSGFASGTMAIGGTLQCKRT